MKTEFWIKSLEFDSRKPINLESNSIVVLVGPNNSGKSLFLREINLQLRSYQNTGLIIKNLNLVANGNEEDFLSRIESRNANKHYYYPDTNSSMDEHTLKLQWNNLVSGHANSRSYISNFLVKTLDTQNRLDLVSPPENIDFLTHKTTHPIQVLKEDATKESVFSDLFKEAFGEDVIVNHGAGKSIPLHVGGRPVSTAENDRVSTSYQQELRKLPALHLQGDGMKSFAGVFLSLFAEDYSINLIDEPEAFLHPPQARLLGRMISQKLSDNKQIFVGTHSEHFLKGLLESAVDRLVVIRIQRLTTGNSIKILDSADLKSIWQDSILKHSNILDGLFHKKVVLVESDSDCRFYNALSDAIVEHQHLPSPDILFIQSGGKHRFPVIIKALQELEVPLKIIGDFDFYHDEKPVKTIFELLGGEWKNVQSDFNKVKKAIDEKRPELEVKKLKEEIDNMFSSISETIMPESKIKDIQTLLKKSSPWSQAKASGKAYLPAGEATLAFNRMQIAFKAKNIHILELGEIEAFDKSVGGHGPKWVNKVLEQDLIASQNLEEARKFVIDNILS